jgi:hypothetical protein
MIKLYAKGKYPEAAIAPILDAALLTLRIIDYKEIPDEMADSVRAEMDKIIARLESMTGKI